jgi:hypothetical protein
MQFKLSDADETFLQPPRDAVLMFAGTSGAETWIERETDTAVRLVVKSVAAATSVGGNLQVAIEVGEACAKGEDGPSQAEAPLRACVSVQVLVKAGERLNFKAYPTAANAVVLRTVVCASDLRDEPPHQAERRDQAGREEREPR